MQHVLPVREASIVQVQRADEGPPLARRQGGAPKLRIVVDTKAFIMRNLGQVCIVMLTERT